MIPVNMALELAGRGRLGQIGLLVLVLVFGAAPDGRAIEELEAEENIAELLPAKFPGEEEAGTAGRMWAFLPEFGFGPDTGFLFGGKYAHRDFLSSGISLDLEANYSLEEQASAVFSVASPNLRGNRFLVLFRGKFHLDPQREFFGLGNNEVGPDPASTHEFQEVAGALTLGWRPFERVALNFGIGLRYVDIRRGKRKEDFPFTPDEFPGLPGIHGGKVTPFALSVVWNTRDDVVRPTRGWRLIAKIIHNDSILLGDFQFTRFLVDASYLRSFRAGRQIFGVRVAGEWSVAPRGEVPFWELSELGGPDTLRGFFPHRFVGRGRVLFNGEYRFRIHEFDFFDLWRVRVDGVLFGDGGRVFIDRDDLEEEFTLDERILERIISDFQWSAGAGLRFALSQALLARIDVGFSEEERALVYLSFGHTF
ncbi:MAG: hypothetical protein KatS3mg076_1429 [Candidatus Binatia bacterium]|nr:MAG: hypothetical protein KatS3mg076_1429 [Candidatus Binatia bacterium]